MVGDCYGLADIALFAYTHVAPEGGISLAPYSNIYAWIESVPAHPGYIPISHAT
ncbi:hypothetical protein F1188_00990 [Roseospira marina]|uniref:Uncharacterized protein n=1 Tax=Roseospira marina TaxID=140057 RepID=A0A5M6IGU0_9PROT|nr:glutathione binding-like protein [Roseospira marina]KAA5607372.1 hypothetical protein F1188_00990 [Roseospira marina]MBB4312459.1 glutathione S-transferase [Roseospira marina]MBB5085525.1 glutathione S-transferase [Roseospira marina]